MSKKALVDDMIERSTVDLTKKQAKAALDALIEAMQWELTHGNEVALPGIGKFKVKMVAPRKARNLQTGEAITVAGHRAAKFAASQTLKLALAG